VAVLVYIVAVGVAAILAITIYRGTAVLHEHGAPGRWLSRCLAGVTACLSFVTAFLATGHGDVLSRSGKAPTWGEGITVAVIMGLGYATLWPVAGWLRRGRGFGS